jgi:hypothetical protein
MPDLTFQNRMKLAKVRNHLAAAVNDLPWLPDLAPMFRDIQSLMRGCTDLIAGGPIEDDHDAPADDSADHWHDGAAPIRRPAYMVHPKAIGELDEREAAREGCGEFPHDDASEELRIMTRDWEC